MSASTSSRVTAYRVFGRKNAADPLTGWGTVESKSGQALRDACLERFGDDCLEMVALPESHVAWAIRAEESS